MNVGDTVRLDQVSIGWHLWIVFSRPTDENKVLAASVTTRRNARHEDHSCILTSDDHPWLRHDSWVKYDAAQLFDENYLSKYGSPSEPLREDVLKKVLLGAATTDRIRLVYTELLMKQGLID
jgi:hypothetical protein